MSGIGIVACSMIRRELESILPEFPQVVETVWIESALHIRPKKMKETIVLAANKMAGRVAAIFLGYGFCRSLRGIEEEIAVPVVHPRCHDCISLLLTPERYYDEVKKEAGTWFMTPGWAEIGPDQMIRELGLERVRKYGKEPMELVRRFFANYRRGLYIDTGAGEDGSCAGMAEKFCRDFNLAFERTTASPVILRKELARCAAIAGKVRDGVDER